MGHELFCYLNKKGKGCLTQFAGVTSKPNGRQVSTTLPQGSLFPVCLGAGSWLSAVSHSSGTPGHCAGGDLTGDLVRLTKWLWRAGDEAHTSLVTGAAVWSARTDAGHCRNCVSLRPPEAWHTLWPRDSHSHVYRFPRDLVLIRQPAETERAGLHSRPCQGARLTSHQGPGIRRRSAPDWLGLSGPVPVAQGIRLAPVAWLVCLRGSGAQCPGDKWVEGSCHEDRPILLSWSWGVRSTPLCLSLL